MTDETIKEANPGWHLDAGKVAKDLVVTALLATAIFGSTIAYKTVSAEGGLALETRYDIAFYIIAAVVVGRLILWLAVWSRPSGHRSPVMPANMKASIAFLTTKIGKGFATTMLLIALVFPFLPFTDRYLLDLGILVLTYVMLGWGLNIVVGLAGLLDLGYVAFYAIGAYSYALLAQYFGLSFWICLPLAGILAAFWGIILGFPVLRLRGDYLAIVTLAFGEIIRVVLLNWYWFTGGPDGLSGIPRPSFFGIDFNRSESGFAHIFGLEYSSSHRIVFLYFLILALALLTNFVTNRLRRLPIGRAWEALREDEIACRSLGLNTTTVKLTAFATGGMFAGFAGSFFATRQGFISPESFTFIESALILAIVVLGGMGSQIGVVIAAIVMIGGFEIFREAEQYRMLIFGLAMVFIMIWRPRGLISTRIPSIFLKEKKAVSSDMVSQGEGH
ncbi:MAG: high-affinity branched-chain amino acid ABC transporter permease LivM [Sneathiella sp.]|nr:high-affinity branched-chain amino acid ABC transporter permease LivM [Sneathiella sp.]